jgi:hypothetical protein
MGCPWFTFIKTAIRVEYSQFFAGRKNHFVCAKGSSFAMPAFFVNFFLIVNKSGVLGDEVFPAESHIMSENKIVRMQLHLWHAQAMPSDRYQIDIKIFFPGVNPPGTATLIKKIIIAHSADVITSLKSLLILPAWQENEFIKIYSRGTRLVRTL